MENILGFVRSADSDLKDDGPGMYFIPSVKYGDRHWRYQQIKKSQIAEVYLRSMLLNPTVDNVLYSNCAFVTLTVDPKKTGSEVDSWFIVKRNMDMVLKRLRRFGIIDYMKAIESHGSGYPHVHMLVVFKTVYPVNPHVGEDGIVKWRFPSFIRDGVRERWPYGFIDIWAVVNEKMISEYLQKELTKNSNQKYYTHTWKGDLTFSFLWHCKMKYLTYSRTISDLIKSVKKNSPDLLSDEEQIQRMNTLNYEFLGVFSLSFLEKSVGDLEDYLRFSGFDPPDEVLQVLERSLQIRHPEDPLTLSFLDLYYCNKQKRKEEERKRREEEERKQIRIFEYQKGGVFA